MYNCIVLNESAPTFWWKILPDFFQSSVVPNPHGNPLVCHMAETDFTLHPISKSCEILYKTGLLFPRILDPKATFKAVLLDTDISEAL